MIFHCTRWTWVLQACFEPQGMRGKTLFILHLSKQILKLHKCSLICFIFPAFNPIYLSESLISKNQKSRVLARAFCIPKILSSLTSVFLQASSDKTYTHESFDLILSLRAFWAASNTAGSCPVFCSPQVLLYRGALNEFLS